MSGEGLIAEPRAMHGSPGHARLAELMHRGTEFLGCELAILGGAMSWVSERHLVAAISNAGGFGVIACGAMTPDLLDTEIAETKKRTSRPFGVILITMHPMLPALIDTCARHGVTHVVLAGGLPPGGARYTSGRGTWGWSSWAAQPARSPGSAWPRCSRLRVACRSVSS